VVAISVIEARQHQVADAPCGAAQHLGDEQVAALDRRLGVVGPLGDEDGDARAAQIAAR
jgi:hypothetical protein